MGRFFFDCGKNEISYFEYNLFVNGSRKLSSIKTSDQRKSMNFYKV